MAFQINRLTIVYSTVCSRRRLKKTPKLCVTGFFRGNNRWPLSSPHKGPVTPKMFPFDDVTTAFHRICKMVPALQHIPIYVQITKYSPPGADSVYEFTGNSWWRHQMETFSALLAPCEGNPPVAHKAGDAELWCFLWANNGDASDLRRYCAY